MFDEKIQGRYNAYTLTDTFMGFHCGNTPACKMCADRAVKYQLIQHRVLEPAGSEPDISRGTLEGDIAPSDITFYRLQCDSQGVLRAYIAQGEVLDVPTGSFGGIGVFAIPRWDGSTAMCSSRRDIPTTALWPSPTWANTSSRCSSSWAWATLPTTSPRTSPIPRRTPSAKKIEHKKCREAIPCIFVPLRYVPSLFVGAGFIPARIAPYHRSWVHVWPPVLGCVLRRNCGNRDCIGGGMRACRPTVRCNIGGAPRRARIARPPLPRADIKSALQGLCKP